LFFIGATDHSRYTASLVGTVDIVRGRFRQQGTREFVIPDIGNMTDKAPWILDEGKREIFLITAADADDQLSGMIITWVSPAGLVPDQKRIMMALSPTNHTTQVLLKETRFAIHLLRKSQVSLVPIFGTKSSRDVNKFENVEYILEDGLPIIAGTCGWMIGKVVSTMEAGDRIIVLADIEQDEATQEQDPLYVHDISTSLLPSLDVQALDNKFRQDIVRDRQMRADSKQETVAGIDIP
jgi:flavin reductase (DIM6/NTAB) family NADH-FMN oxidoreductase RutF